MEALGNIQALIMALPLEWLFLGGVLIVVALDSLRSGMGRAVTLALALPIAYVLYTLAGQSILASAEGLFATPFMQAAVLAVLVVTMYFLIRRMGYEYVDSGAGAPVQAILAGAAVAVIIVCIWLQTPVLNDLWAVSAQVESVFRESFRIGWLLAAYVALAFARG